MRYAIKYIGKNLYDHGIQDLFFGGKVIRETDGVVQRYAIYIGNQKTQPLFYDSEILEFKEEGRVNKRFVGIPISGPFRMLHLTEEEYEKATVLQKECSETQSITM